ncbi:MAG: transporter substrate-binding domain-containing protein, partial [Bacteroidales bacterium]|nr:transporter substrate-binding domain-containing protein [Bacteroidales bacterium]
MKTNRLSWLLALWLPLSAFMISAQQLVLGQPSDSFQDTIIIASEPDYPPYCIVEENGEAAGFSIDLFKAVAKEAGLKIRIKVGIWNQIKKDLAEGQINALPLVGKTPEREELFDFTMPYLSLHGAVFVRKGTRDIHSITDLKGKSVVVMEGDNAEEFVRREHISDHVVTTKTLSDAFYAVAEGNHDVVVSQRILGLELLKDLGIKNVVPLDFHLPEFRQDFCFAVKKGDTALLSRLNEGLSIIIANKTFERIRYRWFGPRFKEEIAFEDILRISLFTILPVIIIFSVIAIFILRKEVKRKTRVLKREIAEHEKTLEALQASEEKYHGMILNLMEGFYSVSLDGTLLDHNTEFARLLKLDPDKNHAGINLPDFWQDPAERETYIDEIQRHGFIRNYEISAKCADGEQRVFLASARIVKDKEGKPLTIEGSFLDISLRKKAEKELQNLKNQLEETVDERTAQLQEKIEKLNQSEKAMLFMVEDLNHLTAELQEERRKLLISNQELEAFTYSVSHDLRAPLRAIDGYGNFLMEDYSEKLGEEGKRFIGIIRGNAVKMDRLISDLLSLSRISRADINLTRAEIHLIALSMYHEIATEEEKKEVEIHIGETPPVYCDVTLMKQVWQNLLSNALKYSSKSAIKKIEINATERDKEVIFSIRDYGAGFDDQYKDKLFGVFQRLHSEAEFPGTGVGLAIVKRIIQRHGGRVWAEGKSGQGA